MVGAKCFPLVHIHPHWDPQSSEQRPLPDAGKQQKGGHRLPLPWAEPVARASPTAFVTDSNRSEPFCQPPRAALRARFPPNASLPRPQIGRSQATPPPHVPSFGVTVTPANHACAPPPALRRARTRQTPNRLSNRHSCNPSPEAHPRPRPPSPPPPLPPSYRGKGQGKGKGRGEGRLGQGGRGRSKGGEKPMGTTAYGGKGSEGRAANGDRPVGAARCRRDHHTMASCQNPPRPPRVPRCPAPRPISRRTRRPPSSTPASSSCRSRALTAAFSLRSVRPRGLGWRAHRVLRGVPPPPRGTADAARAGFARGTVCSGGVGALPEGQGFA